LICKRCEELTHHVQRLTHALDEIKTIAEASEGVEFYAMLAKKALEGEDRRS
jgi:hypothetical protein